MDYFEPLKQLPSLNILDISSNLITNHETVIPFFAGMPGIISLQALNNPYCKNIRQARRNLILVMPNLFYFDNRPVEEVDRLATEAWKEGGIEAERAVRVEYFAAKHRRFNEAVLKGAGMTDEKKEARSVAFCKMTEELREEKSELFERHQDLKRQLTETKENDAHYTVLINRIKAVEEKLSADWYKNIKARGEDGVVAEIPKKKVEEVEDSGDAEKRDR